MRSTNANSNSRADRTVSVIVPLPAPPPIISNDGENPDDDDFDFDLALLDREELEPAREGTESGDGITIVPECANAELRRCARKGIVR